jgi:outer membrane protein assembly factor BamA
MFFLSLDLNAQNYNLTFKLEQIDSLRRNISQENYSNPKEFKNIETIQQYIKKISEQLNTEGYFSHQIEIVKQNDTLYKGLITFNCKTTTIKLLFDSDIKLPKWIKHKQHIIEFSQVSKTLDELYQFYENLGYSFSQIELKNIATNKDQLTAKVHITLASQRNIDKVVVKGYKSFPKKYINNYLHIKPKSTFNKETIESTSEALRSLNFIMEIRKPEILFSKDSTHLYLYLNKKNSNKFDGLVGFTSSENGKLQLNGYLDVELNNSFDYGEQLSIYWSNNGNEQERFKLKTKTPYIFKTPISPSISFEIYKQDSTFINTDLLLDFDYSLNRSHTIGASFISKKSTNLLEDNTNNLVESFSKKLYGILYDYKKNNPRQTVFFINSAFSLGTKTSEEISTAQYYAYLDLSFTEKFTRKSSIYIHNRTETLKGRDLLQNELFQIGGANTIRGFYEQSLFSPSYNFTNLEYRLLTSNESYIYTFSDFGVLENLETDENDRLYSFGLGYVYKTKGGFINLNYAFGKINKTPFDFTQGVFHIKFTTIF